MGAPDAQQSVGGPARSELASRRVRWKIADMMTEKAGKRRSATPLLLVALIVGCTPAEEEVPPDQMQDDVYVQVMTELLLLDAGQPNRALPKREAAAVDSLRNEILVGQGVTAQELIDFADSVGGEAGHMEALWERITHQFDSTRVANLREQTEARSEAEGKLGEEARVAEDRPDTDSTRVRGVPPSGQRRMLQRPDKSGSAARDTTARPR